VGSHESGVKGQNHLLRKAAVRAHAWQQTQEGQKQTAGIGAKASQTIAKGHQFAAGSIQGQELVKNQQGREEQAGKASGMHKGLQPQEHVSSRILTEAWLPKSLYFSVSSSSFRTL